MKKILLIISLIAFGFSLMSQTATGDATRNANIVYKDGFSYAKLRVTSADVFTASRDTVDYVFNMRLLNGAIVKKVAVGIVMDLTTATDTLYEVTIYGEDFDADDYTSNTVLAALETAVITASGTFDVWETAYTVGIAGYNITTLLDTTAVWPNPALTPVAVYAIDSILYTGTNTVAAQTITPSMAFTWRKYVVRIIYSESGGGDEVGTGLTLNSMELKLSTD